MDVCVQSLGRPAEGTGPLGLELQMVVSHCVGGGTWVLWKSRALTTKSTLSSPCSVIF